MTFLKKLLVTKPRYLVTYNLNDCTVVQLLKKSTCLLHLIGIEALSTKIDGKRFHARITNTLEAMSLVNV